MHGSVTNARSSDKAKESYVSLQRNYAVSGSRSLFDRLSDHFFYSRTAVLAPLPVAVQAPRDRLFAAEKSLQNLRHSSVPLATFCMLPLVGALPAWVVKLLATNQIATCILSIFPAPANTVYCMGNPVEDIMFGGGLLVGNVGMPLIRKNP